MESYRAQRSRCQRVEPVAGPGGAECLRSEVLWLELRAAHLRDTTVLVIRKPLAGEEFDDAVLEFDRRRRIAEDRASAAENELTAARDALRAKNGELSAARDALRSREDRVRELKRQLRNGTGQTGPLERDSPV